MKESGDRKFRPLLRVNTSRMFMRNTTVLRLEGIGKSRYDADTSPLLRLYAKDFVNARLVKPDDVLALNDDKGYAHPIDLLAKLFA